MASNESTPSITGLGLICVGGAATAIGGLGVGFRASGLGYLGQSLLALVIGLTMLTIGLKIAAAARRSEFASARSTPARVHVAYSPAFTPTYPSAFSTGAPPTRIRVHAWTSPQLELPAGRAA